MSERQVESRPRWGVAISRDSKGRWGLRSRWGVGAWVAQEDRLYWGPRSRVAEDGGGSRVETRQHREVTGGVWTFADSSVAEPRQSPRSWACEVWGDGVSWGCAGGGHGR